LTKTKVYSILILFSALLISGTAAFYSITGLSEIFAGSAFEVKIMAGSLELGKLILAASLHYNWDKLNRFLKVYLSSAVVILIIITSMGIFGFLSAAYQATSADFNIKNKEISLVQQKIDRHSTQKNEYSLELSSISNNISELTKSISNPSTVQYVDKTTGQLVSTTSTKARKVLQEQLNESTSRRNYLTVELDKSNDSINVLEINKINLESELSSTSELGPLIYITNLTGWSMDTIVVVFILTLVLVFDPLAVSMIIFYSRTINYKDPVKTVEVINEVEVIKEVEVPIIKEVPVEKIVEKIIEVPIIKEVEVIKEVPVEKIRYITIDTTPEKITSIHETMLPLNEHLKRNMTSDQIKDYEKKRMEMLNSSQSDTQNQ